MSTKERTPDRVCDVTKYPVGGKICTKRCVLFKSQDEKTKIVTCNLTPDEQALEDAKNKES